MARDAAKKVLMGASLQLTRVTDAVFGPMKATVFAPSLDISIIRQLQLKSTVKQLNVEAMSCLTRFRLTGLCCDIAAENKDNIALLIVCDIRSALGNP